jgi:RNA polymerase sigma-70 factor (ECF subfamily)
MASEFHSMLVEQLPRMRAYAIMLTRDRSRADDLLQEMAFRALRAQEQFTMGTNFTAWLYRILRNEYISSLRRAKHTPVPIDAIAEECFARSGGQEDSAMTKEVYRAMDKLPPGQREVILLVCASGLSYDEAAEAMGCSVGTIKSRLWRARAHMQSLLLGDEAPAVTNNAEESEEADEPVRTRPTDEAALHA